MNRNPRKGWFGDGNRLLIQTEFSQSPLVATAAETLTGT